MFFSFFPHLGEYKALTHNSVDNSYQDVAANGITVTVTVVDFPPKKESPFLAGIELDL